MTDLDPAARTEDATRSGAGMAGDDLDRLVARSLAASERGGRGAVPPPAHSRGAWPWILAALLVALLFGMLANPWLERRVRGVLPTEWQEPAPSPAAADLGSVQDRLAVLEADRTRPELNAADSAMAGSEAKAAAADPSAGIEGRLLALESAAARLQASDAAAAERLDRLVADVAAVSGGSTAQREQVRTLLLAESARQLFDRGRSLEPLLPSIRARFGMLDSDGVAALVAWSGAPVTRQSLAARLEPTERPDADVPADGWWSALKLRLMGLVQVRAAGSVPELTALSAARNALMAGNLELAIAQLSAAPTNPERIALASDARRLLAAEQALDRMELATLDGLVQQAASPPARPASGPAEAGLAMPAR